MKVDHVFINEGSLNENSDKTSTIDDDFFVVVLGNKFRIYRNRLEFTYVECSYDDETDPHYKGKDECVTAAAFSEQNDYLYLGTSLGFIRYINLQELVNINEENYEHQKAGLVPRAPYQLDVNSNMPITSIQRFTNWEREATLLVTQNFDTATILVVRGDDEPELQNDINLRDLGDLENEAQKKKMAHMLS